jgi:hypothetical protein
VVSVDVGVPSRAIGTLCELRILLIQVRKARYYVALVLMTTRFLVIIFGFFRFRSELRSGETWLLEPQT